MMRDELAAIRDRCDAATPGQWEMREPLKTVESGAWIAAVGCDYLDSLGNSMSRTDAIFIAHARTDIPALLNEVDVLRELYETAMNQLGAMQSRTHAAEQELERVRKLLKRALKGK